MKRAVLFITFFFTLVTLSAQQSVEKTLIKPINLLGSTAIDAQLAGEVVVKEWAKDHAQVEIQVTAYGINEQVLKSLVAAGRYNIKVSRDKDTIILDTPALSKSLEIRGSELKDEVTFILYVPTGCIVNMDATVGMNTPQ